MSCKMEQKTSFFSEVFNRSVCHMTVDNSTFFLLFTWMIFNFSIK